MYLMIVSKISRIVATCQFALISNAFMYNKMDVVKIMLSLGFHKARFYVSFQKKEPSETYLFWFVKLCTVYNVTI